MQKVNFRTATVCEFFVISATQVPTEGKWITQWLEHWWKNQEVSRFDFPLPSRWEKGWGRQVSKEEKWIIAFT